MTNQKRPQPSTSKTFILIIPIISTIALIVILLDLIQLKKLSWDFLGIVLSCLGILIPVIFFFLQWLDETTDRLEKVEKEVIRNTAKIEYFGKFQEVNNSLTVIYERQTKIIQKIGLDTNENIQQ